MILAIVGPTGVGKTRLSVELAKKYDAIIINADAMQVYRGMNIGTAKIREEEKCGIPHFLFDIVDVDYNYTVYDYQKDVRFLLKKYKNRHIIFVGGTGLYLKAALFDYRFSNDEEFDDVGYTNEELYTMCLEKDCSMKIHKNNRRRMVRFLSRKDTKNVNATLLYPTKFIGLTSERDHLYSLIEQRVDEMFLEGLLDEVRYFYDQKIFSKALMSAIGYKECYSYFKGEITKEECILAIKKNSRHYAKRQYTFFRHQLPVEWFTVNYENFEETILEVENFIHL